MPAFCTIVLLPFLTTGWPKKQDILYPTEYVYLKFSVHICFDGSNCEHFYFGLDLFESDLLKKFFFYLTLMVRGAQRARTFQKAISP